MTDERFPVFITENTVRSIAALVFLLAVLALVFASPWIALVLAIDFALRSLVTPKASFLAIIAKRLIAPRLKKERKPIPFRPKRFAAGIGLILSVTAFLLASFEVYVGFYVVTGVLALFSALEAFAGFCAGCEVFVLLMRLRIISVENCPECANLLKREEAE